MNASLLGSKIARHRKKLGLTQLELAEKLHVSDKTVSKWENGGGFPEISILPALSEIFGVSTDYLLKGDSQGIAVAGNIIVDILNIIDKYPDKSMIANVLKISHAVGGCVPNTLIDISKIDTDMYLTAIAKVGNDDNGRFLISQMQKHGIDVSMMKVDDSVVTSSSNVMSEMTTGDRTFFYSRGANSSLCYEDIDIDALDCKIFHIGYLLLLDSLDAPDKTYGTKMAKLLHDISAKGIKTSIDVISEDSGRAPRIISASLSWCDYTIMNEIESSNISGYPPRNPDGTVNRDNMRKTMEKLMELGVREKVIVHCSEAGFLLDKSGEFVTVPSLALPKDYIKGSVGAGDAYAAACLYGLYHGYDNKRLLEFASAAAACNLAAEDSISGMRSKAEIEELQKKYERKTNW